MNRAERPDLSMDPHPLLEASVFTAELPGPLGELDSPVWLRDGLRAGAPAPIHPTGDVRTAVRALLRHGGYKPAGRGKPASEYLARAAGQGALRSINAVVDACNVASLHSGLPVSVVDLDRARPPFRIGIAGADSAYAFNAAGQQIRLDGLLCLHDREGPCANAVKDSQRTKTSESTRSILAIVWGTTELPGQARAAAAWYREMLEQLGASTEELRSGRDAA